ncbi:glycosyltransferase family 9 protein [Salidesulfovibrio onnuriiensis]|uniref:glycosyltransferase family 9 protein n=1 Tax=Salidesulfovibrio onnuriiensis TaxID=2583823 RepID=UPI0011CC05C2|nr:glycosyltransferase family 9 protein [Salidesulfovibrio onnuriiensis]
MKHYLVIQIARFGDLIQTKRLVKTLLSRQDGEVHLCIDSSLKRLAELVYPETILHPIAAHGTGLNGEQAIQTMLMDNRKAFAAMRNTGFDEVYNLNFSPLNFRLAALFAPETVRGYRWQNGQEIISTWSQMAMRWSRQRRIAVNLVDFWGLYCTDAIAPEQVNPEATPKGGGIGVVLAGRESRRSLPPKLLAQISAAMSKGNQNSRLLLLGSVSERRAGEELLRELPEPVAANTENLAGKTNWDALLEIVGSLDRVLTPDTGTMHLAAHLGTPVNAFFLSSAWCFETGPYGLGHTVYQAVTHCLPCLETQACTNSLECLDGFLQPQFIRFLLTGKAEHAPCGITAYHTEVDDFGITYEPFAGEDPDAQQRREFRRFLARHVGKSREDGHHDHAFARQLYRDKDWLAEDIPGIPSPVFD